MLHKFFRPLCTLSTQVFVMYWVSFMLMLASVLLITKIHTSNYRPLDNTEIQFAQREISQLIRDQRLASLIYENANICDKSALTTLASGARLAVLNGRNETLCALTGDEKLVHEFIDNAPSEFIRPFKKMLTEIEVIGPFNIFLNIDSNTQVDYQLYLLNPINVQDAIFSYIKKNPVWVLFLVMLISTPILFWLARSISKPARDLRVAANAIAVGNFQTNKKLENQGALEMRLMGASFNRMVNAINGLMSSQQNLLSSISHELRTPLTRLQLALSILRRRVGESKELQRIETEIERLDKMIGDLLLLSRQQLNSHLSRDVFNVNEVWEEVFDNAKFEAEQRSIKFDVRYYIPQSEQYQFNGNLSLLSSAVENIVRNALKYTRHYVLAEVKLDHKNILISVDDNGLGVPSDKYKEIFQPFYRVDEMRPHSIEGHGLGLAIVANIVNQHHGDVWAEKSVLNGLRVVIRLPLWHS